MPPLVHPRPEKRIVVGGNVETIPCLWLLLDRERALPLGRLVVLDAAADGLVVSLEALEQPAPVGAQIVGAILPLAAAALPPLGLNAVVRHGLRDCLQEWSGQYAREAADLPWSDDLLLFERRLMRQALDWLLLMKDRRQVAARP